jgi:uncharacterized membrane protein
MSKIVALIYPDTSIPAETYAEVRRLQHAGGVDLIDVTEVEVKANGKLKFENAMTIPLVGSASGLFLPAFVGLIFFHPQPQANDKVQKTLQEISLNQNFIRVLSTEVFPRNSVLFLYLRNENTSLVTAAMLQYGGRTVDVSLSSGQEEKLNRLFRGQPWPDPQYMTISSSSY